jgi:replicative DNA helicase
MEDFDYLAFKTLRELGKEFKEGLISLETYSCTNVIKSGFDKLDEVIGGFQPSNLILVGGTEGMGKTSFIISLIKKMAIEKKNAIAFFSLKLTSKQVITQIVSQQTKISAEKFLLDWLPSDEMDLVYKTTQQTENSPLYVYDYPFLTVSDIEETLGFYPPDFVQCIVIDSLQLLAKGKNDNSGKILNKRELSEITFKLKKLAKKLNITILVTANFELVRKQQSCKRPLLSDVRKYAPVDSFADLVLLIYRPEYYKIDEWDNEHQSPTVEANGSGFLGFHFPAVR